MYLKTFKDIHCIICRDKAGNNLWVTDMLLIHQSPFFPFSFQQQNPQVLAKYIARFPNHHSRGKWSWDEFLDYGIQARISRWYVKGVACILFPFSCWLEHSGRMLEELFSTQRWKPWNKGPQSPDHLPVTSELLYKRNRYFFGLNHWFLGSIVLPEAKVLLQYTS